MNTFDINLHKKNGRTETAFKLKNIHIHWEWEKGNKNKIRQNGNKANSQCRIECLSCFLRMTKHPVRTASWVGAFLFSFPGSLWS